MDFLALPRRDLQALCKRNGVRANMTSAAMADALRALPKIDGIEEYVKQPVPVPQPEVEAVVEEEQNVGKQGSLPPRGRGRSRRTVAKSSEPIETKEDKEEEKGNAQNSKEDAPVPSPRGASRRARPVPVVPQSAAAAEEEGQQEEDLKREAERDNAPAPVVGRRGTSRRARPSPAMAAQEDEAEVAGVEEEKRDEVEDPKRKATMDDVPALGAGRRGANRRARAAPSVAALGGKVSTDELAAEEEQGAQTTRGRRVMAKGTSSEPIRLDDSDDEEKEDAKPDGQQEDAQILGVGRRGGASRRAQAAPAAAAPEAKAEEEQRAPVPRARRGKANSTELIRIDDKEKPEEEKGDVPAIAVGRHGASRRAPAPSEAPGTRRSAAASKADAGDVSIEAAPIRATRQRKPTMKAAAAATATAEEKKAPRKATRSGEVMSTLQQEVHKEPHEALGAPNMAVEAVPIRSTRRRKPTMKAAAVATAEEKAPPRATRRGAVMKSVLQPMAQEEPQASYQRCDALKEVSDPQEEELNEVEAQRQDHDQDMVIIIENEKLMEEFIALEASVTDQAQEEPQEEICEVDTQEVSKEKEHTDIAELHADIAFLDCSTNISQVAEEVISEKLDTAGEETNLEVNAEDGLSCQEESDVVIDKVDSVDSTIIINFSSDISWVEIEKAGNVTSDMHKNTAALDEDGDKLNEVITGDNMSQNAVTDEVVQEEKGVLITDEMLQGIAGMHDDIKDDQFETAFVHVDQVVTADSLLKQMTDDEEINEKVNTAGDQTNLEVNAVDGFGCQKEEGDVVVDDKVDSVDNSILLDCSSDIRCVEMEKAGSIRSEMPENTAALDEEDGHKPNEVIICDNMSQVTVTDEVVREEKGVLITDGMHDDIEDDHFETVFTQIDQVVTADSLLEQMTDDEANNEKVNTAGEETNMEVNAEDGLGCQEEGDPVVDKEDSVDKTILLDCSCEISWVEMEKTGNVTSEMPENRAALDEDGDEQMEVITTDKVLELTGSNVENVGEKNSAEPMVVLEEKGVKVASEVEDLNKLSLAQLRAKYKEKMIAKKNKEAKKRVALGRVDENVCRSHSKGQQQNLNLRQH